MGGRNLLDDDANDKVGSIFLVTQTHEISSMLPTEIF